MYIKRIIIFASLIIVIFIISCQITTLAVPEKKAAKGQSSGSGDDEEIDEDFLAADRTFFQYDAASNYYYCLPWNYGKEYNAERSYPLVVHLHGSGSAGVPSGLNFLGYDSDNGIDDSRAVAFQKAHPSFVLVPQTAGSWDNAAIIALIESFKTNYRINTKRIYLIGYSMGGSGSYALANAYYDHNQTLFAGIIRLAGQSQTTVRNAIAANTGIWMHIGLADTDLRVSVTREAYDFLKAFHVDAVETSSEVTITTDGGITLTLTKNGREIVKKTEYNNADHGVVTFPFDDPYLTEWLYDQRLP